MNHVYRIVWSHARQAWVVVAEFARGRGKAGSGKRAVARSATPAMLVLAGIGLLPLQVGAVERSHVFTAPVVPHAVSAPVANPTGGTVVAGAGEIASSGNVTTITQDSRVLSLTWESFDIGADSTVTFVQPDALAVAVNRILGTDASRILGRLDANGQVFLINPHGVVFGEGAQVSVGGLVASTLDLEDDSLAGETLRFSGDSSAAVVNLGTLTASDGGYIALLGHNVSNHGTIRAQLGSVALGAGSAVTLRMDGQQLVDMQVERSALEALVENHELIVADGGQVLMTAGARDSLLASVVNNTGLVQARTVGERDGRIVLLGGMEAGSTHVDGMLDASAPGGGDGGFIETSAAHVQVADSARITTLAADGDTGTWLIDPQDYTIATTGGDITGAALSANLATTDIEIQSASGATAGSGDIHVDDAVAWDADTTLTLTASNDININADLTATGDNAGLVLNPDTANGADAATGSGTYSLNRGARITLSGLNPYLSIGGNVYTVINSLGVAGDTSAETLQGIAGDLTGYYALGSDIDASGTATWNGGAGFDPLGQSAAEFSGTLDGLGHAISDLTIASSELAVGLFGQIGTGGEVRNLVLEGGTVTAMGPSSLYLGALAGRIQGGQVENVRSSAVVEDQAGAGFYVGGLVGHAISGTIRDAHARGSVTGNGSQYLGGLVGLNQGTTLETASATGAVQDSAGSAVGGLVGYNAAASIRYAYATGPVTAANAFSVGGLVGTNDSGTITQAYATGNVTGGAAVGGLVGRSTVGYIENAYATGAVTGTMASARVGGIAGFNDGVIYRVHASGAVTGTDATTTQGLVGWNDGAVENARWDTERTGQATAVYNALGATTNVVGLTHAQMFDSANFGGFMFTATPDTADGWVIVNGRSVGGLNNVAASGVYAFGGTLPMLAFEWQQDIDNAHALQLMAMDLDADYRLVADIDAGVTGDAAAGVRGADVWGTEGFVPIGVAAARFTGSLDGNGHAVSGLGIEATTGLVGLFGYLGAAAYVHDLSLSDFMVSGQYQAGTVAGISEGRIEDVDVAGGSVSGTGSVGGLVGNNAGTGSITRASASNAVSATGFSAGGLVGTSSGSIASSTASGTVTGGGYAGGLVGDLAGTITDSSASGAVGSSSTDYVGGLVGTSNGFGSISRSSASGAVTGDLYVGGLVGYLYGGSVAGSSATGAVDGASYVGGLVGYNRQGTIGVSWATGSVIGSGNFVGGLAGDNSSFATISQSYATGPVQGNSGVGGLVGTNEGTIDEAFSLGAVTGNGVVGAVVGGNSGTITDTFWNTDTTGHPGIESGSTTGVTGMTSAQLIAALPTGFDLAVWGNQANQTTPYLLENVGPVFVARGGTALYTPILTVGELQAIQTGLAGNYALFTDIDASATTGWNDGAGFAPIGSVASQFTGVLDGLGHSISGLFINRPSAVQVGLFGAVGGVVRDVGLVGGSVTADGYVGSLAGVNFGTVERAWASGTTVASGPVGIAGGLVGRNDGTISQAFATGSVTSTSSIAGGLVGLNRGGVSQSFAAGAVTVDVNTAGGLVGGNDVSGTVTQSYATGAVAGTAVAGGLVGSNSGSISQAYSSGTVAGSSQAGGLVGSQGGVGSTTSSYWDTQASGMASSAAGIGRTTAQMRSASTFSAWDMAGTWKVYEGNTAPLLRAFLAPLTIDVDDVTVTYDGTAQNGSATYATSGFTATPWLRSLDLALLQGTLGSDPARNAGSYTLDGGLYSGQLGYDITFVDGTLTIDPKAITVGATASDKVYDGTANATAALEGTGVVSGDDVAFSGTASFDDKNAGTGKTVTVSGISASGADAGNYTYNATDTDTANITAKAITVDATASDKVYDGTTAASATLAATGVVSGDDLSFSGTAEFDDKHAGTGKTVTVEDIAAGGADAGNYTYNATDTDTADITPKAITVDATASDKVYDGTTAASASLAATGIVAGDDLAFSGTAAFDDKHAGTGKTVTVGVSASGADAGNYTYNATDTDTADITPKAITVDATASDKVYDGTTAASATLAATGVVAGDDLAFSGTAAFDDKHAGTGKTVTVGVSASGVDAGNYSYNATDTDTADITPKAITVDATASDKVYDGTTAASATLAATGVVAGDDLAFSGTAAFDDKHAGTGKTVTVGVSASGVDAGNYSYNATDTDTADITPKAITVDATASDKVYDGTTAASATLAATGVIAGDDLAFSGTAAFDDRNAGTGKTVTVGVSASGVDAGNYSYNAIDTDTAEITPKAITVDATASDKVYDGTTTASATFVADGVIAGDDLAFSGTAAFDDKHAGTGKTVTVGGIAASGTDAGNYTHNATDTDTADITPKAITVDATASDKVYDGTTTASATLAATGVITGDDLAFSGSASFDDKGAGTAKTVTVDVAAAGADAANYTYNATDTDTADITPKAITVDATAADKVYDGTTAATAALAASGVIAGDDVAFTGSASFADKHAGVGKTVTVGVAASGGDAANYTYNATDTDTADITPKAITVDASASDKVYDGTNAATATLAANGIVAGDDIDFAGAAEFDDKHVGNDKTVTVDGIAANGADAGNYSYNTNGTTTADVTPATLTYRADPATRPTGEIPTGLSGDVDGLVAGETLEEATDGTLAWTTPATSESGAGQYAIEGGGLSAGNYVFVQAPGNSEALTLVDGTGVAMPDGVGAILASLQAPVEPDGEDDAGLEPPHLDDDDHAGSERLNIRIIDGGVLLP